MCNFTEQNKEAGLWCGQLFSRIINKAADVDRWLRQVGDFFYVHKANNNFQSICITFISSSRTNKDTTDLKYSMQVDHNQVRRYLNVYSTFFFCFLFLHSLQWHILCRQNLLTVFFSTSICGNFIFKRICWNNIKQDQRIKGIDTRVGLSVCTINVCSLQHTWCVHLQLCCWYLQLLPPASYVTVWITLLILHD